MGKNRVIGFGVCFHFHILRFWYDTHMCVCMSISFPSNALHLNVEFPCLQKSFPLLKVQIFIYELRHRAPRWRISFWPVSYWCAMLCTELFSFSTTVSGIIINAKFDVAQCMCSGDRMPLSHSYGPNSWPRIHTGHWVKHNILKLIEYFKYAFLFPQSVADLLSHGGITKVLRNMKRKIWVDLFFVLYLFFVSPSTLQSSLPSRFISFLLSY
jgi:hypothetical protein